MSGLEVVASVSAIFTLVDTGFSLAKALNTYISEVSDSRDDIVGLCSDIDSTFRNLRELALVIEKNETTKVWSDDGLENARKCARDADVVVRKMRKLLQKGGASITQIVVEPEHIDVQKLKRFMWPIYKGEFEVRRRELQSIKLDILIAYTSYNAKAADTSSARQRAEKELPLLYNAKVSLKKDLKKARRNRSAGSQAHLPRLPRYEDSYDRRRSQSSDHYDNVSVTSSDLYGLPGEIIYESIDDLYKEFYAWEKEKAQRKKQQQDERQKLEEAAVERWKKSQQEEIDKLRATIQSQRDRMNLELTRQQVMNEQQIQTVLDSVYPFPDASDHPGMQTPSKADVESLLSASTSDRTDVKSVWSKFSGRKSSSSSLSRRKSREIPSLLRDPTNPGGLAQLKAMYFQRMLGPEGERIQQIDVDIPEQWLLQKILFKDEASQRNGKCNSIWKDFAQLPDDYRYYITNELKKRQTAISARNHEEWVLLYVEGVKSEDFRRKIFSTRRIDVIGVYIVLKRVPRIQQLTTQSLIDEPTGLDTIPEVDLPKKVDDLVSQTKKTSRTSTKSPDTEFEFKPEPQRAASYIPREDSDVDLPSLRHSIGSQNNAERVEFAHENLGPMLNNAHGTRKAHFADDPVTQEKTISIDGDRRRDHSPPFVLLPYPGDRERSRDRSFSRYSEPRSRGSSQIYVDGYERERYRSPSPPISDYGYYPSREFMPWPDHESSRNSIVIDSLGTAWDRRPTHRHYVYESEDDESDYTPRRRPSLTRANDLGSRSRTASKHSETKPGRSSLSQSRRYDTYDRYDEYGYPPPPEPIIIENRLSAPQKSVNTHVKLPYTPSVPSYTPIYPTYYPNPYSAPLPLMAPPRRQGTFDSETSQPHGSYLQGHRMALPSSLRSRSRSHSSPVRQPAVQRQRSAGGVRADSNTGGRRRSRARYDAKVRNAIHISIDDSDTDTISLASYDGEEIIIEPQVSKPFRKPKEAGLSMLDRLTNSAAVVLPVATPKQSLSTETSDRDVPLRPTLPSVPEIPIIPPMTKPLESNGLLEARLKLVYLQTKHAEAVKAGDIVTASDLIYFAIPDVEARIKELESLMKEEIPRKSKSSVNQTKGSVVVEGRVASTISEDSGESPKVLPGRRSGTQKMSVVLPNATMNTQESNISRQADIRNLDLHKIDGLENSVVPKDDVVDVVEEEEDVWGGWGVPSRKKKDKAKSKKESANLDADDPDDGWGFTHKKKQKKKSTKAEPVATDPDDVEDMWGFKLKKPEKPVVAEPVDLDDGWGFSLTKKKKKKNDKTSDIQNGDDGRNKTRESAGGTPTMKNGTSPAVNGHHTPEQSSVPQEEQRKPPQHSQVEEVEDSGDDIPNTYNSANPPELEYSCSG